MNRFVSVRCLCLMCVCFSVLFFSAGIVLSQDAKQYTVAVLDLEANGVSQVEARVFPRS